MFMALTFSHILGYLIVSLECMIFVVVFFFFLRFIYSFIVPHIEEVGVCERDFKQEIVETEIDE